MALQCVAGEPGLGTGASDESKTIEFRINGEAVTREYIQKGLREANECAPEVCPTEPAAAWDIRRSRLIQLIPLRQFLDREGIVVKPEEIEARLAKLKAEPNPFGKSPPKPLTQVMVRDCLAWDDVRLLIRVDLGMKKWAERERRRKWPTSEGWTEYCRKEKASFDEHYGKFRRLSFSLSKWPKGAKDEEEALALLKQEADRAKERLAAGESFAKVAAAPATTAGNADPAPAAVLPFDIMGPQHVETLRQLAANGISPPLATRFSWEIVQREPVGEEEMAEVLKSEFVSRTRLAAEGRVTKEAKLDKVNWTATDTMRGEPP